MAGTRLFAERALLPDGWARDVLLTIDAAGFLSAVQVGASAGDAERAKGVVLPGMPNLHSHAFQRAMAGLGERAGPSEDSFWTWRQVMYDFVARITPGQLEAIAAQLYVEMLKAGYTAVGEFHYLHHGGDGRPYADRAEMSRRIAAAASASGIGLTHLPVLYGYSGFGGSPAGEGQRRFLNAPDEILSIIESLSAEHEGDGQVQLGLALHSLRAVTPGTLAEAVTGLIAHDPEAPIHIHVAEQTKEVDDCLAWSGKRPVEWLLDTVMLNERWCLVHATHMTADETRRLARSGAVAGLCPTTEANLGDGLFPAPDYLADGGAIGIGSDSHISVSPIEELRWLEYGQRLVQRRRNLLAEGESRPSVGARLYDLALAGGARAMGRWVGRLTEGYRADLLVLDPDAPTLLGREGDLLIDSLIFSGNQNPVRDVMVGGRWVVEEGRHIEESAIFEQYKAAVSALTS